MSHFQYTNMFAAAFVGAAIFSCSVVNSNHCGLNQGSCGDGEKCSVCEVENNGCIPLSQDAGSIDGKSCEFEMSGSSTGSENNSSSSFESSTTVFESTSGKSSDSESSESNSDSEYFPSTSSESSGFVNDSTGTMSFCGDGILDLEEECDEGLENEEYSNAQQGECTIDCKFAFCGDTHLNKNEECEVYFIEDGPENNDDCSNTCQRSRFMFVTSEKFTGDLNWIEGPKGLELANKHCNRLASDVDLYGNYVALLGNGPGSLPIPSLVNFDGRFRLPDSQGQQPVVVENGYQDLMDGFLLRGISITEKGFEIENADTVWTGLKVNGDSDEVNCKNWQSKNATDKGVIGVAGIDQIDYVWINQGSVNCNLESRLFCVEI